MSYSVSILQISPNFIVYSSSECSEMINYFEILEVKSILAQGNFIKP